MFFILFIFIKLGVHSLQTVNLLIWGSSMALLLLIVFGFTKPTKQQSKTADNKPLLTF